MKFSVRFKIGNRLGAGSVYSLREICTAIVDRYSLKEKEIEEIVQLKSGGQFTNEDMQITRVGSVEKSP